MPKPQLRIVNPHDPFTTLYPLPMYGVSTDVVIPKYDGTNYSECFMAFVTVAQQQPDPHIKAQMFGKLRRLLATGSGL